MTPTDEQVAAVEAFGTGGSVVIEAGAGAGKTSLLVLMAESTERRGQYCAFNRSIVNDSGARFPQTVAARTIHSLAFGAVGKQYADRLNGSRRVRSDDIARALRIDPIDVATGVGRDRRRLSPGWLAGHVMAAVNRFCQSADDAPGRQHFVYVDGLDMPDDSGRRTFTINNEVQRYLTPYLTQAWLDLCQVKGTLRFEHSHYLKIWQLHNPLISADYILIDEAQDIAPVMRAIVEAQSAQRVWVGDSAQEIYTWSGAINALAQVQADHTCYLTLSFRFGPEIAAVANAILGRLDTPMRLRGLDSIASEVIIEADERVPDCILTRTNACSVRQVLFHRGQGRKVHLIGDGKEVLAFARGAEQLQQGGHTNHRDLSCFSDWPSVQAYVSADALGHELRLLVQLVDEFGVRTIEKALGAGMAREMDADVVVSTAHKFKGREARHVKLADDFPNPGDGDVDPAELKLLYVAATRAKNVLDLSACPTLAAMVAPAVT